MTDPILLILSVAVIFSCRFGMNEGQTITPVYVQNNSPVTLTCPADDQTTTLTWTGPGGTLYVTGTTVETDLHASVYNRTSADHMEGSYTLTFTEFRSSDTGIYTCTVDRTVDIQMVIVQGVTSASPVYTRQGGTATLQCPDTGGRSSWSVTSINVIYTDGTDFNPAIPNDTETRLSVTRQDGTYNLQIIDVQLSDVREYKCNIGSTGTFYHLLLYIQPSFPEIENSVSVDGQNRTTGTEDTSMTLICNSRGGTPAASVSWIKDGTTLVTSTNTVQYTEVFTRADDRTLYTCQSSSPTLTSPQTTSVLVYLDLKPGKPTISDQLSQTENTNLQVVCVSTGSRPTADIEWNVRGTWLSNNPTEVKVKDSATDTYTVTSTLSLPVTHQDNGKTVVCKASNRALSGGIESVQRSITVLFGPDDASIKGNGVVVADGTNTLTLTCTTQEYNRHVHITWYNGTSRISNTADVTNTSGTYGGSVSTQVLQLTPDRYQDGNVIKCVVQNEDVILGERTASVTLNINYRPYLTLTATPGVKVIEGTELGIRCDVDSKPAPSSITWSRVGGQLPSNSDVTSGVLRIRSTHRTDRGTYQCTAQNTAGTGQERITIDFYYPPDIHVTYTNTTFTSPNRTLTCVPDGNPANYQFGQWRHLSEDGTEIRQLTGSPLQSVLTLPDPGITRRYEDTGYYVCQASNNIPDSSFFSSGSVFFVVEAPPVLITNTTLVNGQIGDNATMEVEFYSRPGVAASDVTWTKGTDELSPTDKFVTSVDTRLVQMSFYGVGAQVKGYVAAIQLHHLVEQDFGNYTATIRNSIGANNFTISFKSASQPLPPRYVAPLTYDSSSITLQWTPSFNGGAEQSFVISYKSDIYLNFVDLPPIPATHKPIQSYTITGLKAETTYFIRIHSENEIGKSDVVFFNQTTSAAGEKGPSIGPLVGGIAGSALGLIAIAVVAVVIYKRRTAAKDGDMEMINGHSRRSEDNRDSDGIKPNILYESSDGLKPNVLYESAGANFIPQPGPSSEYAIVSKPNKKKGAAVDPNSVYAVVDKSNKDKKDSNDVYAEVFKQPKEKGGKKEKQPNKKKLPDKKKHPNKNKQPDKKKSKGGDEYENISSEQATPENVYANSKDSAEAPSRVKNQDGLLYLEVEFKDNDNSERRAVIHGIENRTDYADVDFTQHAVPLPAEDESAGKTEENGQTKK